MQALLKQQQENFGKAQENIIWELGEKMPFQSSQVQSSRSISLTDIFSQKISEKMVEVRKMVPEMLGYIPNRHGK